MTKRLLTGILVMMVVLQYCLSVGAAEPVKLKLYVNPAFGFEIRHPESWKTVENLMGTAAVFVESDPNSSKFSPNVNVIVQDLSAIPGLTLEEYEAISLAQLNNIITDLALHERRAVVLSQAPARVLSYSGRQGIHNLRWQQAFTIIDDRAYLITFTCEEKRFKSFETMVADIFASFQVVKPVNAKATTE